MATPATPTRTTPTRTPPSTAALRRAVEPVEAERFLTEHWERQPLVVPRGVEGRFDDLLSTRDVERLLTETGIREPAFRLVKAGETVTGYSKDLSWRPSPFTGVADVRRVLEEFERGATIVLQGLHHLWLPLARYCRQLESILGQLQGALGRVEEVADRFSNHFRRNAFLRCCKRDHESVVTDDIDKPRNAFAIARDFPNSIGLE